MTDFNCTKCGRRMEQLGDNRNPYSVCTPAYSISPSEQHPQYKEFVKIYGKKKMQICLMCFAEQFGLKPLPLDGSNDV